MSNIKVSELDETTVVNDEDLFMIVQNGKSKRVKRGNAENKEKKIVVSSTEPVTNEKVWIKKGKNLFNKNSANTYIGYFDNNNIVSGGGSTIILNYIEIIPNVAYTISLQGEILKILFYNKNKELLKTVYTNGANEYTFNENACYIRIQYNTKVGILDTLQIEQNATATTYEAYIEPTIFVKNGNSVYEVFQKKDDLINYSLAEQKIGTWYNGETVYRKVFTGTTSSGTGLQAVLETNSNVAKIINAGGHITRVGSNGYSTLLMNDTRAITVDSDSLKIYFNNTKSEQYYYEIWIEYTKTVS